MLSKASRDNCILNGFTTLAFSNDYSPIAYLLLGDITFGNVAEVLPFQETFDAFDLQGRYLLEALENSVAFYNDSRFWGRFLQISGNGNKNASK